MGSSGDYRKRLKALNGGPLRFQREAKPGVAEIRRQPQRRNTHRRSDRVNPLPAQFAALDAAHYPA